MTTDSDPAIAALSELIAELPEELRRQALTHSSWTERRVDSYERLAFLGDSVLGLSVAGGVYERFTSIAAGGLTKIHNQAVSGVSCAAVGRALGVPEMLSEHEPEGVTAAIPASV
ncbi:MAG TPA: ribonuclease III domain-containing protein, partial [Solirubrobacterales bacterium]|nr:ribonuclease III domain-containing protein [Solirubrobacterales bacterium]